jgi:hypothetical protein
MPTMLGIITADEQQLLQLVTYLDVNKIFFCHQRRGQGGGEGRNERPAVNWPERNYRCHNSLSY